MKNYLKILLVVVASLVAGAYLHKCQSLPGDNIPCREAIEIETDTVTVYDTIPYIEAAPVSSHQIGYKAVKVSASCIIGRGDALPCIIADTTVQLSGAVITAEGTDSLTLQLPMTQNVYEGEEYKAYVSGVYPSLDSLFVYPRRETVTIKKPPKRWHIGPTVGIGYTPDGFEPFIGISLTYSIIDF